MSVIRVYAFNSFVSYFFTFFILLFILARYFYICLFQVFLVYHLVFVLLGITLFYFSFFMFSLVYLQFFTGSYTFFFSRSLAF